MSYLVDHHRAVADPFGMGLQAPHIGLMMNMTRGRVFPWTAGGVALLRRELYPDVHEWTYCGLAIGEDTQSVPVRGGCFFGQRIHFGDGRAGAIGLRR